MKTDTNCFFEYSPECSGLAKFTDEGKHSKVEEGSNAAHGATSHLRLLNACLLQKNYQPKKCCTYFDHTQAIFCYSKLIRGDIIPMKLMSLIHDSMSFPRCDGQCENNRNNSFIPTQEKVLQENTFFISYTVQQPNKQNNQTRRHPRFSLKINVKSETFLPKDHYCYVLRYMQKERKKNRIFKNSCLKNLKLNFHVLINRNRLYSHIFPGKALKNNLTNGKRTLLKCFKNLEELKYIYINKGRSIVFPSMFYRMFASVEK